MVKVKIIYFNSVHTQGYVMGMKYITVPGNIYLNYLNYGALTLILFEPQFGHSVAPFFMKVFLHEMHQNMELPFFISSRSSGIIENPEYVLHITTSITILVLWQFMVCCSRY